LKIPFIKTALALTLTLVASSASAEAAHYRWMNDRGEPIFSDRPPPQGVDYEVISSSSNFKRAVSAEEGAVPLETQPRVGNEFEQTHAAAAERLKKNPELCQRARTNLEAMTSSAKVQVRNDQGEIRLLTPEEMEVQKQTAKAQISVYCE
jgi:hypothetical protein